MKSVQIRKQGGAAIMTIPSHLLAALHVNIGDTLELDITDGVLLVKPAIKKMRKQYSLEELLAQCDENAPLNEEDSEWLNIKPIGLEL